MKLNMSNNNNNSLVCLLSGKKIIQKYSEIMGKKLGWIKIPNVVLIAWFYVVQLMDF